MRKSKVVNRKYTRKILQIEDHWDSVINLVSATTFQEVLNCVEKELHKRFNVIESKLYLVDKDFINIFESTIQKKKYLEKESIYLDEEGILDWVQSTKKTQIVPSPFYSYGKSAVIITPLYCQDKHIGYFLSLSKNNRLSFNDLQLYNIDTLIQIFNSKLISFFYQLRLQEVINNVEYYENLILNNVNYIDKQIIIDSTSKKISQSLNIVKSNLNLIEKDAETFYTRLNKISHEIDSIIGLNSKLTLKNNENIELKSNTNIDDIIYEVLEAMEYEIQNSNLEVNFNKSTENYTLNCPKGKFRSAIINLLVYILNQHEQYSVLNIYYKFVNDNLNIIFYLGVENYSFTNNMTLDSPVEVNIPNELEITNKLLKSINFNLKIVFVDELGYFFNIVVK